MSIAAPNAGFAVIDEKPSEPPHCRPTMMWLAGTRVRVTRLASGSISFTASTPAATVLVVPPSSCMTNERRRELSSRLCSLNNLLTWLRSQPSPMTSAAARLACSAYPAIVRRRRSIGSPVISMPQPVACANATTPSTFGNSASRSGVKYSATLCTTVAEQLTVDSTPM